MNKPRLLLVEDEIIVAVDLARRLDQLGYEVVGTVASGEQALALAEKVRPELALVDIRLAGAMDGIEAAKELRSRLQLPVVFLTAYADIATLQRAKMAEPYGYIRKPFEILDLQAVLEIAFYKFQAERKLRASEERHRTILQTTMAGFWLADMQGRLLEVNTAYCRMSGYNEPELLALRIPDLEATGTIARAVVDVQKIMAHGRDRFESLHRRKDGSIYDVEVNVQYWAVEGGQFVVFLQDITERKQLEERNRQSQKMAAIGRLAGGMAHEFNNILASLMLNLDLAKQVTQETETRESLVEMAELTHRAANLISQLLAFSRQSVIQCQPMDLAVVIGQQCKMLNRLLGERIRVEFYLAGTQTWVYADKSSLEQVLLNLCLNARDAMKDGGVLRINLADAEVSAETAAAHLEVQPGKFVCWSVSDTGSGMSAETMERLFEPFFTTKDVGQGTGLGLATVRGMVEQHHGWVEAETRVGEGSTFRVYLPAVAQPLIKPAVAPVVGMVRGEGTILLVEDELVLLKMGKRLLNRNGYTVLTAMNSEEALAVWAEQRAEIDLLYTDMVMPGKLTGLQLAKQMQADKPSLKVIITSGYITETLEPGEDSDSSIVYLSKPCAAAILTQVIQKCLQQRNRPPGHGADNGC